MTDIINHESRSKNFSVTNLRVREYLLANQRGCVTVIWNQQLTFGVITVIRCDSGRLEQFRYDLCTKTWHYLWVYDGVLHGPR
jgi:hypothetical protein